MKLTFVLLTAAFLQVSAKGVSQTVTFSGKNVSLERAFDAITQQTGYAIFYNAHLLQTAKPVTVDLKEASIEVAMRELLKDQTFSYSIIEKTIVIKSRPQKPADAIPPPIDVRGRIVDDKGEPAVAATILVKGTTQGTMSNDKGEFELKGVPDNAVLTISGVNIETREVRVDGKTNLVISVKTKVSKEKEAIVTAYGIEKSTRELGYSVVRVKGEDINRANPGNLLLGLTGRVSGLNISEQSSGINPQMRILLRGIRSISANTNNIPLFIVNGAPLSFGSDQVSASLVMDFVNNINPADIEDVTVLKGANGTALYGPEGVNGVIIITTKKGGKGTPSVNFRNNTSFQQTDYRYRTFQKQFGSGTGGLDQFGNGVYDPMGNNGWGPQYDGQPVPIGFPDENGDILTVPYRYTKDRLKFMNIAMNVQNNLSITQSDNRSDFYLGLNYANQSGLLPKDKQNRASVLLNTGRQVGRLLNVRVNLGYTRTNGDFGSDPITEMMPYHIPLQQYSDYQNDYWSDASHFPMDRENPYAGIDRVRTKSTENALFGNLTLTVKPFEWLTLTARPGLNYTGYYEKQTSGPINFSDHAKMYGGSFRRKDYHPGVRERMRSLTALNSDFLVNTLNRSGNFMIRTTAGATIRENYQKLIYASAGQLAVPVYSLDFSIDPPGVTEQAVLSRFYSLFGTGTIGYKDRVFLEITGRNDWDSKLAKIARDKNFYSGANTSVVLNEVIPDLAKVKWLTTARLRASVTFTANMNIEPYQAERLLTLVPRFPYGTLLSYSFVRGGYPNPFIKPEKVISQEYGGSFSFLKDRIQLDIAYYYQKNIGLILNVTNGWLSTAPTIDNAGKFANFGWEFDLKINPIFKLPNGLTLTAEGRFSINDNKVLELSPVYDGKIMVGSTLGFPEGARIVARTGQHAFEFELFDWKRDPQGRVIVDRVTGMPQPDRSKTITRGRSLPKYTAAVNFNLSWKGFTLTALAEYRGGSHVFAAEQQLMMRNGLHPITAMNNRQRFVFPNSVFDDGNGHYTENTDVAVSNAHSQLYNQFAEVNNHFLTVADFWKIRELALSYEKTLKTRWAKRVSFTLYARDLFSFYPKSNITGDPLLIGGPGDNRPYQTIQTNLAGTSSSVDRLPGTVLYGLVTNISF